MSPPADSHAFTTDPLKETLTARRQEIQNLPSFVSTVLTNLLTSSYFDFNKILETVIVKCDKTQRVKKWKRNEKSERIIIDQLISVLLSLRIKC